MPSSDYDRFSAEARALRGAFFEPQRPITLARAPGWIDLLGGAAPGGPLALGWPLGGGSFVALQPTPEPALLVHSGEATTPLPLAALTRPDGHPREYAEAAAALAGLPSAMRIAGAAWIALMREEFARFPSGARVLLHPTPGPGWQIGALAATAQALVSAFGMRLAPRELGLGCQVAAQRVLDTPASVLGPLVSVCAPASSLLQIHPQPAWIWGPLHMPHGATIWALRVGDGPPPGASRAEVAAAIAYRMAADSEGLTPAEADARWLGYLANLGTARFERSLRDLLPASLGGTEFLARYGQLPGVAVDPQSSYPVRAAAALAIGEHLRARTAAALLRAAASKAQREDDLALVGELLDQSHWAQRAAGLSDRHADQLADAVAAAGMAAGLYGARAPATDSGATLVVLGRAEAEPVLRTIAQTYAAECGLPVTLFGGSSAGCGPAGTRDL